VPHALFKQVYLYLASFTEWKNNYCHVDILGDIQKTFSDQSGKQYLDSEGKKITYYSVFLNITTKIINNYGTWKTSMQ
jgi:hypothetical protein